MLGWVQLAHVDTFACVRVCGLQLLRKRPSDRMQLCDVPKHPWIRRYAVASNPRGGVSKSSSARSATSTRPAAP